MAKYSQGQDKEIAFRARLPAIFLLRLFGSDPERSFLLFLQLRRLSGDKLSLFSEILASGRPLAKKSWAAWASPRDFLFGGVSYSRSGLYACGARLPNSPTNSSKSSSGRRCDLLSFFQWGGARLFSRADQRRMATFIPAPKGPLWAPKGPS